MNIFKLKKCENGDIYFDNLSPMYPSEFESKINQLAKEKITDRAPELGGFFGNFINTFVVKFDKIYVFRKDVLPFIGHKSSPETGTEVWDKDECVEACEI